MDGTAQIVGCFAPGLGTLAFQALQLLQCILKIEHAAGSLGTLQLLVAGGAFAHPVAAQAHEGAPGKQHDTEWQPCPRTLVGLEFSENAAMQMAPLTNGLAL